ncbi:reverse transcriptase [Lasius niger]|uniref:Reverse transcriptase n=1 Tax=Lasius niger TaxID=67767 RepID=A0A0J7NKZ7_LASNI|nr:reverse transcriptase [Lasius niger]
MGLLRALMKCEDKDEQDPKSYRPIYLLSVIGKLFEKLIKLCLMNTLLAPGEVSDRQFGFMPERSTEDAVVELRRMVPASEKRHAVALLFDISEAFDNVWWPLVLESLKSRDCQRNVFGVMQSYFDNRKVSLLYGSPEVSRRATRGCPHGSVLGPATGKLLQAGKHVCGGAGRGGRRDRGRARGQRAGQRARSGRGADDGRRLEDRPTRCRGRARAQALVPADPRSTEGIPTRG